MNYGRAYSPPCEGGVSAPSKNGSIPKTARTGWSLTGLVSKCVLKHWRVSDHPVCGASVAARLFIDAAATPPLQGGECAPLNSSTIHSSSERRRYRCSVVASRGNRLRHGERCSSRPCWNQTTS